MIDFVIGLMIGINTWLVYLMFRKPEEEQVVSKEVRRVMVMFLAVSIMHMVAKDI